jgi:hypothetical protein
VLAGVAGEVGKQIRRSAIESVDQLGVATKHRDPRWSGVVGAAQGPGPRIVVAGLGGQPGKEVPTAPRSVARRLEETGGRPHGGPQVEGADEDARVSGRLEVKGWPDQQGHAHQLLEEGMAVTDDAVRSLPLLRVTVALGHFSMVGRQDGQAVLPEASEHPLHGHDLARRELHLVAVPLLAGRQVQGGLGGELGMSVERRMGFHEMEPQEERTGG